MFRRRLDNDHVVGYFFIMPFIVGFLAFTFYPILASFYYSFTSYDLLSPPRWIGLDNFERMLNDPKLKQSLKVTFTYVFSSVPLRLGFALFVAMLLNVGAKAIGVYRTAYYLPSIIGGSVAVAIMWRRIFGDAGAVNSLLGVIGIETSTAWISYPATALYVLVSLSVWQFGSSMLIFLAGLKNIPETFYEAANVDGAGPVQRFFRITLPMLTPVIFFNLIMQTIAAFMTFTSAFVISDGAGGPLGRTLLYSLYLYQRAFRFHEMGYGAAMAWFMLLIVAILTGLIFLSSRYWVHYEEKGGDR